jgi:tRNA A37 threonylcarbamoyladenosine dehydratase
MNISVCQLKSLPTEREKISVSYTSDKGLITRIKRKLRIKTSPKFNDPMKQWTKEVNIVFSKEKFQISTNTHEEMLNSPL